MTIATSLCSLGAYYPKGICETQIHQLHDFFQAPQFFLKGFQSPIWTWPCTHPGTVSQPRSDTPLAAGDLGLFRNILSSHTLSYRGTIDQRPQCFLVRHSSPHNALVPILPQLTSTSNFHITTVPLQYSVHRGPVE